MRLCFAENLVQAEGKPHDPVPGDMDLGVTSRAPLPPMSGRAVGPKKQSRALGVAGWYELCPLLSKQIK